MGLDAELDYTPAEVRRAAILAAQLPQDSRVKRAVAPENSHSLTVQLLREIEHNQRVWHWAHSEDAKNKDTEPQRITLPGEEEAYQKTVEAERLNAASIAASFGLKF